METRAYFVLEAEDIADINETFTCNLFAELKERHHKTRYYQWGDHPARDDFMRVLLMQELKGFEPTVAPIVLLKKPIHSEY